MIPKLTDLFVAGGGPAGLCTAIAARRRGLDVIVADASRPPIDKACGEGIMPDGLAAARILGLSLDQLPGYHFPGIRFWDGEKSVEAMFPRGPGLGLRRTVLHEALVRHAAAAGVQFAWGMPVTGVENGAVLLDDERITTRWIVGADGSQSRVRHWAGLDTTRGLRQRYGFPPPLPHRAVDRHDGNSLGPQLPDLHHARGST